MVVVAVASTVCYLRLERSPYARYLVEVFGYIDSLVLDPPPPEELFNGAVDGMVGLLDRNSDHITSQDTPHFEAELEQQFGGVGVVVSMEGDPPRLTVVSPPLFGAPAHEAGVRSGDVIVAIDGEPTADMTMRDVLYKMRGRQGAPIVLTIRREDQPEEIDVRIVRQVINIPSVLGDVRDAKGQWDFHLAGDSKLGYVRVVSFGEKTIAEVEAALAELTASGARGLILDLRDNPGGLLMAAVEICDKFLPEGMNIVTVESRTNSEAVASTSGEVLSGVPLVILINENSASASEIVAGCLQDHKRAVVVGDRSYGKGTVQQVIHIESGHSILKLTTARYLRPSGRNIHRADDADDDDEWGVSPNPGMRVEMPDEELEAWIQARRQRDQPRDPGDPVDVDSYDWDPQLHRAIEHLRATLAD
jgi:carboxyl-terminal processing protease